ncbi:MAG TPA: glycosyltransferase family 87 protein, partial [Polyangia bacterium]
MQRRVIAVLAVGAVAVAAVAVAMASLQQDLAAYWIAGKARWLGLDPYVNHCGGAVAPRLCDGVAVFRHSRFLYPPLAAELFRLLAIVPYRAAKLAFTGAALGGWLLTARLMARRPGGAPSHALAVVVTGALFFPLYFHLERGQIDLLLLPLVLAAWLRRKQVFAAGGVLALAAVFKPALLGVLPVMFALGRRRLALATVAGCVVAAGATVAISGPRLVREYIAEVLPRAALYGEGGTEDMMLPPDTLPVTDDHGETADVDGVTYKITIPPFDGPASASLPRLLAPRTPRWVTSVLPYALVML